MGWIIHESGNAVRAVAPAQPRATNQPRRGLHAVLQYVANGRDVLIQVIDDRATADILYEIVQIIGAGDAGVPGAVFAEIKIIAGVEVDAVHMLEARSEVLPSSSQ